MFVVVEPLSIDTLHASCGCQRRRGETQTAAVARDPVLAMPADAQSTVTSRMLPVTDLDA